jgi:hypothetical protein
MDVTMVELTPKLCEIAGKMYDGLFNIVCKDVLELDQRFISEFDFVIGVAFFHHFPNLAPIFRNVIANMKRGAKLVIIEPKCMVFEYYLALISFIFFRNLRFEVLDNDPKFLTNQNELLHPKHIYFRFLSRYGLKVLKTEIRQRSRLLAQNDIENIYGRTLFSPKKKTKNLFVLVLSWLRTTYFLLHRLIGVKDQTLIILAEKD